MKAHKATLFLVLAVMAAGAGLAEGPGKIQAYFEGKSISVGYAVFGGLTLTQGGQGTWTSAGISPHFEKLLSTYPDSSFALEEFRNKNTTGNILFWGGIAIEIAAPFLALLSPGDASSAAYGSYASIASLGRVIAFHAIVAEWKTPSSSRAMCFRSSSSSSRVGSPEEKSFSPQPGAMSVPALSSSSASLP